MNLTHLIQQIPILHQKNIVQWKTSGIQLNHEGFLRLVTENLAFNYVLWETEDCARRDDLGHSYVYHAKRKIDGLNQQRNNRMESMDQWLHQALQPANSGGPVHSETPGMMIDRLAILALKFYHMALQAQRTEVDESHRESCLSKAAILKQQQEQLHVCLLDLIEEVVQKTRTFRLYSQFKMYNDPTLNPALYELQQS